MHDTWSEGFNLPVDKPSDNNRHTKPQGKQGTPDIMGTATTSVEHKQDGQKNRSTETTQMGTFEPPEGNEDTKNMSPLNGEPTPTSTG